MHHHCFHCHLRRAEAELLAAEKIDEKTKGIMAIVMLVAWCAEAGIGTFRAPFGCLGMDSSRRPWVARDCE